MVLTSSGEIVFLPSSDININITIFSEIIHVEPTEACWYQFHPIQVPLGGSRDLNQRWNKDWPAQYQPLQQNPTRRSPLSSGFIEVDSSMRSLIPTPKEASFLKWNSTSLLLAKGLQGWLLMSVASLKRKLEMDLNFFSQSQPQHGSETKRRGGECRRTFWACSSGETSHN